MTFRDLASGHAAANNPKHLQTVIIRLGLLDVMMDGLLKLKLGNRLLDVLRAITVPGMWEILAH